jgi:ABC-type sugar transport system ATPase subunit
LGFFVAGWSAATARTLYLLETLIGGALIALVEPLGSDVYASLALGTDMLLARASPDLGLQEGAKVSVALNLTRLHLFDDGEGNNLAVPPTR